MALSPSRFIEVCEQLSGLKLARKGPPAVPWEGAPTEDAVAGSIRAAAKHLPLQYQETYVAPLLKNLATVIAQVPELVEPLAGAVYDHGSDTGVMLPLRRFMAVTSNLYRSFLWGKRRAEANFPVVQQLPPLATFEHAGEIGPFTLTAEQMHLLCGTTVGVVSLPSTYREHPLLWPALAHETGGHDVLRADPGLIPELGRRVRDLFGGGKFRVGGPLTADQFLGLLWRYWIDEAAADIYGLLNVGPTIALSLAASFAAMRSEREGYAVPTLRAESGAVDEAGRLDSHPTDILRIQLAIGATEVQTGLSRKIREAYVEDLWALYQLCRGGADRIRIQGLIPVGMDRALPIDAQIPVQPMEDAARVVGAYVATAKLKSLGGHAICELEAWDDRDEEVAQRVCHVIEQGASAAGVGDDAQLLAGATMALHAAPHRYEAVTKLLNDALDLSFDMDAVFGRPAPHRVFVPSTFLASPGYRFYTVAPVSGSRGSGKRRGVAPKKRG